MKKYFGLMLAVIMICSASVFTSCGNADDPATESVSKKCTRFSVVYRINSPKANLDFFDGKYAIKNGDEVKEIDKLHSFIILKIKINIKFFDVSFTIINFVSSFALFLCEFIFQCKILHNGIETGFEEYRNSHEISNDKK